MRANLADYEDLIWLEVKKVGTIDGHDFDDLVQEMRVRVTQCLPRIRGNRGRVYVRTSVRNALLNLKRAASTQARIPHDARGRTLWHRVEINDESTQAPLVDLRTPEQAVIAKQLVLALGTSYEGSRRPRLTVRERDLLERAFVEGAVARRDAPRVEAARCKAENILTRLMNRVISHRVWIDKGGNNVAEKEKKKLKLLDVPECHAMGTNPVGYETNTDEAQPCQDCADKFSCLPDSIRTKLIVADLTIDPEVKEVYDGKMSVTLGRRRVSERVTLRERGEEVPEDLLYDSLPTTATEMAAQDARLKKGTAMGTKGKKNKGAKSKEAKAEKPKASKAEKPKAEAKPKGEKKAKRKAEGKSGSKDADGRLLVSGRWISGPKEIAPEKMAQSLARVKLGLPFDLKVGMELIQERRDGDNIVVKICPNGYQYKGKMYSSLSTACSQAMGRSASGNEVFDFEKRRNVLVKGKGVPRGEHRASSAAE